MHCSSTSDLRGIADGYLSLSSDNSCLHLILPFYTKTRLILGAGAHKKPISVQFTYFHGIKCSLCSNHCSDGLPFLNPSRCTQKTELKIASEGKRSTL